MTSTLRFILVLVFPTIFFIFQASAKESLTFEKRATSINTKNEHSSQSLTLYSPQGMIPDHVIQQFTNETGIEIVQREYNPHIIPSHSGINASSIDVAILPYSFYPKKNSLPQYFAPIEQHKLTHRQDFKPELHIGLLDAYSQYSVPLLIEGMGIATDANMLPSSLVDSWSDLLDSQWSGQLLFPNDSQIMVSIALIELGYPINNPSKIQIQYAQEWLEALASNTAFLADRNPELHFLSGRVSIGLLTNAQAFEVNQDGGNIEVVWPSEGALLDIYALSMLQHTTKHDQAYQLINYLTDRQTQLALTRHTGLTPNLDSIDIENDTISLIPDEAIEDGQFLLTYPNSRLNYEHSFQLVKSRLHLRGQ